MEEVKSTQPEDQQQEHNAAQRDATEWLRPGKWRAPSWYDKTKTSSSIKHYKDYFAIQLRNRYTELESEFMLAVVNPNTFSREEINPSFAERIANLLKLARKTLEQEDPDPFTAAGLLDLGERYMVWVYGPHIVRSSIVPAVRARLEASHLPNKKQLVEQLTQANKNLESFSHDIGANNRAAEDPEENGDKPKVVENNEAALGAVRNLLAILDEAIKSLNQQTLQEQVNSGLQIRRLRALGLGGVVLLVVLLLQSPITINTAALEDWPWWQIAGTCFISAWFSAIGIAIMGAAGGFLSGLLQARTARVSFPEYQENKLKLALKPLVGSLASLVLFIFLSWGLLPGIAVQNVGSYVLIAFLSGFSERYFLRLLGPETDTELSSETRGTTESVSEASA